MMNTKIANAQNHRSEDLDSCIEDVILDRDLLQLQNMILKQQLKKEKLKDSRYAR